jgi:predicted CXXCH cytochrome family protein
MLNAGLQFGRMVPWAGLALLATVLSPLALHAQAHPIEHPGILHKEDNCSACHADKTKGKSVHSAMELACTICHQAQTMGDMTLLQLELPKTEICFSCHEKTMMLNQHPEAVRRVCIDCHDAHSSNRRLLLLDSSNVRRGNGTMLPAAANSTGQKATSQP